MAAVSSRSEPLGIPGEHAGLPDVVQAQVQHGHPLHAYPTSSMRGTPITEGVNVGGDSVQLDTVVLCSLSQELCVFNSARTFQ